VVIKPEFTSFAVRGRLIAETALGQQRFDYWHHTPFFWRVELDGRLVMRVGRVNHVFERGQMDFDLRLIAKPEILAHIFNLRTRTPGNVEEHAATGRAAYR
jgi:hypothetical protein